MMIAPTFSPQLRPAAALLGRIRADMQLQRARRARVERGERTTGTSNTDHFCVESFTVADTWLSGLMVRVGLTLQGENEGVRRAGEGLRQLQALGGWAPTRRRRPSWLGCGPGRRQATSDTRNRG